MLPTSGRRTGRVRASLAALATLALLAAGTSCATDTADEEPAADQRKSQLDEQCQDDAVVVPSLPDLAPVSEGSGKTKVATDFGDVELPVAPKAALGMYTTDVDMLVWLRYPLAGSQPIRGDSGYQTFPCFFPRAQLAKVSTFANFPEYDYESVLLAEPDFILNGLGYDKKVVKRLPQIAPTYSVDAFDGEAWVTHFEETAKALDRTEYYEDWKTLYDDRVEEVKAKIDDPAALTVAPVGYWDDNFQTGCSSGVMCQVFADLGLTIAPTSLMNDRRGEELSGEQLGRLDGVDYAFMTRGLGAKEEKVFDQTLAKAAKNPLWKTLDFVEKDQIIGYEMEMTYGSPSVARRKFV
ncbi:MAG: ABC transporter substrate-binding protein [Streptosporangiales bacterium]|nr:ABC transporter substrate-binding protein [Streptosporangiales bacterium]